MGFSRKFACSDVELVEQYLSYILLVTIYSACNISVTTFLRIQLRIPQIDRWKFQLETTIIGYFILRVNRSEYYTDNFMYSRANMAHRFYDTVNHFWIVLLNSKKQSTANNQLWALIRIFTWKSRHHCYKPPAYI